MSTYGLDPLYFGGRLIACHVYMMLCADDGATHIKIGMSQDPAKRAMAVYNNSPLTVEWMATVDLPSREMALSLERALHKGLAKWRTNGEWFKFSLADKAEFNRIQQEVLAKFERPSRKLRWAKMNVKQMAANARTRQRLAQRKWASSGNAYRDAVKDGLQSN